MRIDEHEDWADDFDTWEDVGCCLQADWQRVTDVRQRRQVLRDGDDLVVVEVDRGLRARQRRELHRMGFRPVGAGLVTLWVFLTEPLAATAEQDLHESWRAQLEKGDALNALALRVMRDVFRSDPDDVAMVVVREPAEWAIDGDWDETG